MKHLILITALALSGCTNNSQHKQISENQDYVEIRSKSYYPLPAGAAETASYPFDIVSRKVSEIVVGESKVEYTVVISNKYNEQELDNIANNIKKSDKDGINYIFISFYLNDMSLKGPNYAISKRTPDINTTQINYVEPAIESNNAPYGNAEIIGKWSMAGGATTIIYKKNTSYYMIDHYSANNYGDPMKLIKSTINGNTSFRYVEDTGETFVIMEDGLYGYMDGDLSCVFSKLR